MIRLRETPTGRPTAAGLGCFFVRAPFFPIDLWRPSPFFGFFRLLGLSWSFFWASWVSSWRSWPQLEDFYRLFVLPGPIFHAPTSKNHAPVQTGAQFLKNHRFPLGLVFGPSWDPPGAVLGHSWAPLGSSWALLGRSWGLLGRSSDLR